MKKTIFLIFIVSFSLYAQESIVTVEIDSTFLISMGPSLQNMTCHAVCKEIQPIKNTYVILYRFDFYQTTDSSITFSFIDSNSVNAIGYYGFKMQDYNKDGFQDISFVISLSAKTDPFWGVFLFHPDINKFIYNDKYSYFDLGE